MKNKIYLLLILLFSVFANPLKVQAQQTIINVPSSEVLPQGDMIFKGSTRFRPFREDGFARVTPSFTVGAGHGIQFSGAVATTMGENNIVQGDISVKKVWFLGESTRLTTGGTISPYLNSTDKPDSFLYAHVSQRIKNTKTSITAGGYVAGVSSMPNMGGVILGVEQVVISNKLRVAVDWTSGLNSEGRMGVGIKYRPLSTLSITTAVIIPNRENDNIAFNVSFSKFLSIDKEKWRL